MVQPLSRDARICIIGAGAAGLTSALTLKESGYTNITVIEREPSVGGKCYTHRTVDSFLELGANIVFPGSVVHRLARRTGARLIEWFPIQIFDHRTGQMRPFGSTESRFSLSRRALAYGRLVVEMLRHRRVGAHGFHACTDLAELGTPTQRWLKDRRLEVIDETAMPFMVGAGLGYPEDEVPVVYFLKMLQFIRSQRIRDLLHRRTYRFEHGYHDLWRSVASQLLSGVKLLLGTEVERVERPLGAPIHVGTTGGGVDCDSLIVTAPDRALPFLDARGLERDLLSRFRYFDMYTVGCTVEGRLPMGLCFIGPHTKSKATLGHAFAYVPMRAPSEGHMGQFVFYAHGSASVGAEMILENLRQDLSLRGCRIVGEPIAKRWPKYFPHVSAQDFTDGFFTRLDELQGQRATYYSGEAISGTNVSVVTDHAEAHIARFFPDHGGARKRERHAIS